jgi:hypothetical protein
MKPNSIASHCLIAVASFVFVLALNSRLAGGVYRFLSPMVQQGRSTAVFIFAAGALPGCSGLRPESGSEY